MKSSVIGIDVGKYELVLYWDAQYFTVRNDEKAIEGWYKKHRLALQEIELIVYEPTGGYERKLQKKLDSYQLPYRRVHANHVRAYAKATGITAKTDQIDAKVLAEYAIRMELMPSPVIAVAPELKALLTRREQLIEMRKQEKNRLDTCDTLLRKWIEKNMKQLSHQLEEIEEGIKNKIEIIKKTKVRAKRNIILILH
jgi:transposase